MYLEWGDKDCIKNFGAETTTWKSKISWKDTIKMETTEASFEEGTRSRSLPIVVFCCSGTEHSSSVISVLVTYTWQSRGPYFAQSCARGKRVYSFTLRPLYPRQRLDMKMRSKAFFVATVSIVRQCQEVVGEYMFVAYFSFYISQL